MSVVRSCCFIIIFINARPFLCISSTQGFFHNSFHTRMTRVSLIITFSFFVSTIDGKLGFHQNRSLQRPAKGYLIVIGSRKGQVYINIFLCTFFQSICSTQTPPESHRDLCNSIISRIKYPTLRRRPTSINHCKFSFLLLFYSSSSSQLFSVLLILCNFLSS